MLRNREFSREAQLRVIRDQFVQPLRYQAEKGALIARPSVFQYLKDGTKSCK